MTFALTQAASGAQARETLLMFAYSKLIGFDWISLFTLFRMPFVTYEASKLRIP
tara:strand:- start:342 stop:503 length:162 start_codon:yes stop_codon:yes gene_type:complete